MIRLTLMLATVFILVSCKQTDDSLPLQKIASGFETANESIRRDNSLLHHTLYSKTKDVQTAHRAAIWLPRADSMLKFSKNLLDYINKLEDELKKQLTNGKVSKGRIVQNIFHERGGAHQLFLQLIIFKNKSLHLLSGNEFADNPFMQHYLREDSIQFEIDYQLSPVRIQFY